MIEEEMRLLVFLGFLLVPVLEIWILVQVGQAAGGLAVIGLLLAGALLGGWLVRREGRRALAILRESVQTGQMPERELGGGAMTMAGGLLLIVPGVLTDLAGLAMLLPFTRPLVRGLGARLLARRLRRLADQPSPLGTPFGGHPFGAPGPVAPDGRGPVIHGQVIREEPRQDDPRPPVRKEL
ncbi:FxsA family protein [Streptosporangium soli]|nr:FxsA family protein [Streptosporangium sp. KLBMP 9127]